MLPIARLTRETRIALGMTQAELSRRASVSLPSVQNIESGRAGNPSLETLSAIFKILGIELTAAPREPDWRALIACGAPLVVSEALPKGRKARLRGSSARPSPELLLESLRSACFYLSREDARDETPSREWLSVQALLWAIQSHYPNFYRKHLARSPLFRQALPTRVTGPLIKLKRQAIGVLAEYL